MQMIGRGLRGTAANGTEKAYIVDFNDNWGTFTKWLNPNFVINGDIPEIPVETTPVEQTDKQFIPFTVIADIYDAISYDHNGQPIIGLTIPVGWFSFVDEEGNDVTVLVMEDQLAGYKALVERKAELIADESISGVDLLKYFGDFVTIPAVEDLQFYLDDIRTDGMVPHLYPFSDHTLIDPVYVAKNIKKDNPPFNDIDVIIEDVFNQNKTAQNMFRDVEAYKTRVWDCLRYPGGRVPDGGKVEELPLEMLPFDTTPHHDLVTLFGIVNEEMFGGAWEATNDVDWTDKAVSRYFGMYIHCQRGDKIRINKLLDSKDVPEEVIKYLLYHEMLHCEYHYHNKQFREQEHKYPNWVNHDRFLDGELLKYDIYGEWKW